jgi:cholesterol transport system auxiliary component
MNITRSYVVCSLLMLMLFVSACSGLTRSDKPATKTWWLKPYAATAQTLTTDQVLLVAVSVAVVPGLDTDRILTLSNTAELNQYAGARWADNLPELLASLVSRTLEASGRFEVVSDRAGASSEDCGLQLESREFFAQLSPSGQTTGVRVAIDGHYQCESGETVPISANVSILVHGDRMSEIVVAFQQALDQAMQKILKQM